MADQVAATPDQGIGNRYRQQGRGRVLDRVILEVDLHVLDLVNFPSGPGIDVKRLFLAKAAKHEPTRQADRLQVKAQAAGDQQVKYGHRDREPSATLDNTVKKAVLGVFEILARSPEAILVEQNPIEHGTHLPRRHGRSQQFPATAGKLIEEEGGRGKLEGRIDRSVEEEPSRLKLIPLGLDEGREVADSIDPAKGLDQ